MKRLTIITIACFGAALVFSQPDEAMEASFAKWIATFAWTKTLGALLCFCAFKLEAYWYEKKD